MKIPLHIFGQRKSPITMLTNKMLISSGAFILTLGVAITSLLVYSPSAKAGPNSWLADLKVVSIGDANDGWCPTDNGSSLTYKVVYENVRDDQAYNARVTFTTGSNQTVSVTDWEASFEMSDDPVCGTWTSSNGYAKVAYCDIASWDTMGETVTIYYTVTTSANDLHVAASVSSLVPEGDGQGVSLMANNYLEHAFDSGC